MTYVSVEIANPSNLMAKKKQKKKISNKENEQHTATATKWDSERMNLYNSTFLFCFPRFIAFRLLIYIFSILFPNGNIHYRISVSSEHVIPSHINYTVYKYERKKK